MINDPRREGRVPGSAHAAISAIITGATGLVPRPAQDRSRGVRGPPPGRDDQHRPAEARLPARVVSERCTGSPHDLHTCSIGPPHMPVSPAAGWAAGGRRVGVDTMRRAGMIAALIAYWHIRRGGDGLPEPCQARVKDANSSRSGRGLRPDSAASLTDVSPIDYLTPDGAPCSADTGRREVSVADSAKGEEA